MSIKVLVALNGAFLPLQDHLSRLPANALSERLRSLAYMGLLIQSGRIQARIASSPLDLSGCDTGSFLRFPVVLNESYPDLHAEMERTPVRLRAERLRALASVGLHAIVSEERFDGAQLPPAPAPVPIPVPVPVPAVAAEIESSVKPPVIQSMPIQKKQELQEHSQEKAPSKPKKNGRIASFAKSLGI